MTITYSIKGKTVETKTFRFQLKSIDEDEGTVTGHLSTFGNIDLQKDRVIKGAFKKTLSDAYSRKKNGRKFLIPDLWMHDPNQPTGGVIEATEDAEGLLVTMQYDITTNSAGIPNNPIATMVFSGHKMGYIDELSMGYIAIQKEFDGGIRNLKEVQLIECSAVTMLFAANPEALTSGVKSLTTKGASGKTTWPLADRATKWDAGEATKDIEEWADGDWSKVAQCFFWVAKSPPETLDDCKLPFVAKDGDTMKAIPQGIISCAGVLQGAMGGVDLGSDEAAVKKKVAAYYKKMDMTPPWEDSDKRSAMTGQRKDFNDLFQSAQAADCLEDWADLVNTLTQTMLQIFSMGDSPQSDMATCLGQFGAAVNVWLEKGVECNLAGYLSDAYGNTNVPQVPYSLRAGGYDSMARRSLPSGKVGATISGATQGTLEAHQAEMKGSLDAIQEHCKSMQQKVSDLTQLWQNEGQGEAYTNDKSHLTRREPLSPALSRQSLQPLHKSTDVTIDDLEALLI